MTWAWLLLGGTRGCVDHLQLTIMYTVLGVFAQRCVVQVLSIDTWLWVEGWFFGYRGTRKGDDDMMESIPRIKECVSKPIWEWFWKLEAKTLESVWTAQNLWESVNQTNACGRLHNHALLHVACRRLLNSGAKIKASELVMLRSSSRYGSIHSLPICWYICIVHHEP